MADFANSMRVSASAMTAQGVRLRTIAENLANADSTAQTPGGEPYRRKVVTFRNEMDRALGTRTVRADRIGQDRSDFRRRYDPQHPAADGEGYVLLPNVNSLVEVMDMREAQRSYEANLNMIEVARGMVARTLDILRS
jgi:flagellar basal-body rod protein FlgC